jgi:hypothetical protein
VLGLSVELLVLVQEAGRGTSGEDVDFFPKSQRFNRLQL